MPEWMPWALTVLGSIGACWAFFMAGKNTEKEKNGYVKREDCHRHIDKMEKDMRGLHNKSNAALHGIFQIMGHMQLTPINYKFDEEE